MAVSEVPHVACLVTLPASAIVEAHRSIIVRDEQLKASKNKL